MRDEVEALLKKTFKHPYDAIGFLFEHWKDPMEAIDFVLDHLDEKTLTEMKKRLEGRDYTKLYSDNLS